MYRETERIRKYNREDINHLLGYNIYPHTRRKGNKKREEKKNRNNGYTNNKKWILLYKC